MASKRCIVEKIVNGHHGPFAVVRDTKLGSITFSLDSDVWIEKRHPESGSEVVLDDFQKKRGGWRAMSARFYRPEDVSEENSDVNQQPAISKKTTRSKEQ